MNYRSLTACLFIIFSVYDIQAQFITVSGYVKDAGTGEELIGANIFNAEKVTEGCVTDLTGHFTMKLEPGVYIIKASYLGYNEISSKIVLTGDTQITLNLSPAIIQGKEVVIKADNIESAVNGTQMGRILLSAKAIKTLPVIFGEMDVLKTITLLPGIKNGGEGNNGLYVRGGGPDQNLILMDGGLIYNPSHLLGFFSVFNGDAVQNIEAIKGGIPARYGGRLSSIINVDMRPGNYQELHGSGGIGIISSRLAVEGPIKKNESSYMFSGRRTYLDLIAQPLLPDSIKGNSLYFYDLNGKVTYKLSDKETLSLTGYYGKDVFSYSPPNDDNFNFGVKWGNTLGIIAYNRQFNKRLNGNFSLGYNQFSLSSEIEFVGLAVEIYSGLKDWTLKSDFVYDLSKKSRLYVGGQYVYHTFEPGKLTAVLPGEEATTKLNNRFAHEGAAYVEGEFDLGARWKVNAGLRYSVFNQVGPYDMVVYDEYGTKTGEVIQYKPGESIALWDGWEPRLSGRYMLNSTSSIKASYTRMYQYLHLATSSSATLPTDLWVPSSAVVKPQIADQVALGYFKDFKEKKYDGYVELYYKPMQNQIEFKPGAELLFNANMENEMIFGNGLAYGAEFLIRKNKGKLTGWLGYTWSRTTRQFDELNRGIPFYYRYDRPHDFSLVLTYKLNKKWEANFVFVYSSGNVITLPVGRFLYQYGLDRRDSTLTFSTVDLYTDANTYRMPAYHRADISVTWYPSAGKEKRFHSSWNFSVYNVYNRKNAYFIYFDADEASQSVSAKMVYLFPILPSITYNFKF